MNILYLTMAEIDVTSGVYKKIISQRGAFERLGHSCRILFINDSHCAKLYDKTILDLDFDNKKDKKVLYSLIKESDLCYARFEVLRHKTYKSILNAFRKEAVDIIVEIPTYPPYQESLARVKEKANNYHFLSAFKTLVGAYFVWNDVRKLSGMAELMCIVADDVNFRNSKSVRIENGIDLESNPLAKIKTTKSINIVAVSNFAVWNGYDRAIEGLNNYIQQTNQNDIKITFVGDRSKAKDLVKLTEKYKLSDQIVFTGSLSGSDLDDVYDQSDIALGALGNHRRKVFSNSSLKAKEYAAKGMLMVLSDSEGIEDEIKSRSLIVSSDERPLDFTKIKDWYLAINDIAERRLYIHKYALNNYSWDSQIKKIIQAYLAR